MPVSIENRRKQHFPDWQMFALVLTLTITLRVSSLGKKTQTQRRSCMVLLLWKFSLFIFCGWDRTGVFACKWGSGPADTTRSAPLLLQLQSLIDLPVTGGSAGREALTGRTMGTPAAELQRQNTGDAVILPCLKEKCPLLNRGSTDNIQPIIWQESKNQISHRMDFC